MLCRRRIIWSMLLLYAAAWTHSKMYRGYASSAAYNTKRRTMRDRMRDYDLLIVYGVKDVGRVERGGGKRNG